MKTGLALVAFFLLAYCGSAFADASLRPGDSFDLRIGGVPTDEMSAISNSYTIDGEGYLNLPLIGKLQVSGMTAAQIQASVEHAYVDRGIFTHPTITLMIAPTARFVNVGGSGVKSGARVPYTPDMTVSSAIKAAGDFNEFADQRKVRLTRAGRVTIVNCKRARVDPSLDVKVLPGDSIDVPESFF